MSTAVPTTTFDYTAEKCLISIHFSIDRSSPFFFFSACNFVVAVCIIHANTQHKQNHANVKKMCTKKLCILIFMWEISNKFLPLRLFS